MPLSKKDPTFISLCFGFAGMSVLLGLLTGVSQTAVAGAAIAAVVGLMSVVATVATAGKAEHRFELLAKVLPDQGIDAGALTQLERLIRESADESAITRQRVGRLLLVFAFGCVAGLAIGSSLRLMRLPHRVSTGHQLPWAGSSSPRLIYNALDWIVVQDYLVARGYSQAQVQELYQVQLREWGAMEHLPTTSGILGQGTIVPLSSLLRGKEAAAAGSGDDYPLVADQPPRDNPISELRTSDKEHS